MGQIGMMTGYRLESIKFELRCVSERRDDWLKAVKYKFLTTECVRFV